MALGNYNRVMCDLYNGNSWTTIIFFYGPSNASDEIDIITYHNDLSPLVRCIPEHNVLIMRRDMNAQIGKDESTKFC